MNVYITTTTDDGIIGVWSSVDRCLEQYRWHRDEVVSGAAGKIVFFSGEVKSENYAEATASEKLFTAQLRTNHLVEVDYPGQSIRFERFEVNG